MSDTEVEHLREEWHKVNDARRQLAIENSRLRPVVDAVRAAFVRHDDNRWCISHGALELLADALDALDHEGLLPPAWHCRCGRYYAGDECPACGTRPTPANSPAPDPHDAESRERT